MISFSGIDLGDIVVNTEYRVLVLEKLLDNVIRQLPPGAVSQHTIDRARDEALQELQRKYPDAGITPKKP